MKEFNLTAQEWFNITFKSPDLDGRYIVEDIGVIYCEEGSIHKINEPAIEHVNVNKFWIANGLLHRLDGPAIENVSGKNFYWVNGEYFPTKEEYEIVAYLYKNQLESYQ